MARYTISKSYDEYSGQSTYSRKSEQLSGIRNWHTYDYITEIRVTARWGAYGLFESDAYAQVFFGPNSRGDMRPGYDGYTQCDPNPDPYWFTNGGVKSNGSWSSDSSGEWKDHWFYNITGADANNGQIQWARWCDSALVTRKWRFGNRTIRCTYDTPELKITVNSNTGVKSVSGSGGQAEIGKTITFSVTPEDGYVFSKWNDGNTSNPRTYTVASGDIYQTYTSYKTFTPTMSLKAYTLTFNANGGSTSTASKSVTYTSTYGTLPTPTRTGYTFNGWYTAASGGTKISSSTKLDKPENRTVYAQWTINSYTVSFKNMDGSAISSKTLNYNVNIGELPVMSRTGYTFAGWVDCAPAKKTDGNILDSLCYYGDKNSPKPLSQSYKYANNLSLHIEAFMDNWENIAKPAQQIISCTEGGGWGLGHAANIAGPGVEVHSGGYKGVNLGFGEAGKFTNGTWYAFDFVFTNSALKVYVNGTEKGTVATSSEIKYNSSNTIFVGGEAGDNATSAAGNYFNGLISNVFIANSNERLAYATTTTKMPAKNLNYYPVWRVNRYTVSFNANGGNISSTSKIVVFNHSYRDLPTPTRIGYTFDGWFTAASGGTQITSSSTFTNAGNQTLYAHWTPITYTIQFNSNMENTSGDISPISLAYDTPTKLPKNNFRKIDYIFNSWNTKADGSGTKFTDRQSVQNLAATNTTITLYAQWDFVGDINYDNLFSFSQWATSENGQMGSRQTTSELSINIQEGSLTIKDNSGETSPDAYTKYANNTSHYTIPVKSNTKYKFSFNVKQNYSSNDKAQFFIFYYTDTGNASTTHDGWRPILIDGIYTKSFTTPANCTKISMRFGVYSANAQITFSNIRIYELNQENKINSITNYKHRDYIPNTSSLLNPARVGYDFNKWINSSEATLDLNGIKNGKVSVSAFSQWTPYNYYIEFNGNGADRSGTMITQTFTYDQEQALISNAFSRYRYNFVNWNTKTDGTGTTYVDGAKILNLTTEKNKTITLFAQWDYIPLETSIFIDDLPVKQIYVDFIKIIEVFKDKELFFRPSIKEE